MSIIKRITEFKWDLSKKGFENTVRSFVSHFTEEKKLEKWVYLYSFIILPILNFLILTNIKNVGPISLGGSPPIMIYALDNIFLMSFLISFTIYSFTISLLVFKKIRIILLASMFTQIVILCFETNIIRKYTLSFTESEQLSISFLILCLLSISFAIMQILKMIYKRIRARILSEREMNH